MLPAFGQYAMIFAIERSLYDSVDGVSAAYATTNSQEEVTTSDMTLNTEMEPITIDVSGNLNEMVSLLYSNSNQFDEVIPFIDNYSDYLESNYSLDLDETFFEDHILVSYTFMNENIGSNLYVLEGSFISEENDLLIQYAHNEEANNMYPSTGEYVIIFAVDRILYDIVDDVMVELINSN